MTSCPHCGHNLDERGSQAGGPGVDRAVSDERGNGAGGPCPSCGRSIDVPPARVENLLEPLRAYFTDLLTVIFRPSAFFRRMPVEGGVAWPLAFALITHWLGAAFQMLWNALIGGAVTSYFDALWKMAGDVADIDHPGRSALLNESRDRLVHWFWGAGSVIADPFFTLGSIFFTTFFVYIGARILVSPGKDGHLREITFESALRVICFGMSPAIFAVFPLLGGVLGHVWILIVTVIGAREVYRIETGRAILVALFPKLLFLGILFMGVFVFFVALLKLFLSAVS